MTCCQFCCIFCTHTYFFYINKVVSEMEENQEYDPYENREVEYRNSSFDTGVQIIKVAVGTGILALPLAISYAGWIAGPIFVILIGMLVIYCLDILVKGIYAECKKKRVPAMTYSEAMASVLKGGPQCLQCFSYMAAGITDAFLLIFQLGICAVYLVFIADHFNQIFQPYHVDWNIRIWMAISYLALVILGLLPDKALSICSLVGNMLTCVAVAILLYFMLLDLPSLDSRNKFANIQFLPLFFGIMLFAVQPVAVVMFLEHKMKKPRQLTGIFGVLSISLGLTSLIYAIFGFIGYWKYGGEVRGSVSLNIPYDSKLALATRIIYIIAVFLTHPVQGRVTVDIIWTQRLKPIISNPDHHKFYEYLVRILQVTLTTLLAIAVPMLEPFISLVGAISLSATGFVFPALIDLIIHWPDKLGFLKWVLVKDICIIIFGFVGLSCGTISSLRNVVKNYY